MLDDLYGFLLWYPSFLIYFSLERLAIAILEYHYLEVFVTIDVEAFHEIWAIA